MNQNQKVNKRALPVPQKIFEDIIKPQNKVQQKILDIIAEVIGTSEFGINTNIYLAGLTSVGAVRLNVLLSKEFDKTVQTKDLKENDTVLKLEKFLSTEEAEEKFEIFPDYPFTKNQEGIFVESLARQKSTIYNIPILLELSEKLDIGKLKKALAETVNAHPYIKTRLFINDSEDIRQQRLDDEDFDENDIEVIITESIDSVKAELVKPFNLIGDRLFRLKII